MGKRIRTRGLDKTVSASVGPGATVELLRMAVSDREKAEIQQFANNSLDQAGLMAGWGDVTWNAYHNGAPIGQLYGIKDQIGSISEMATLGDPPVINGGSEVVFNATNASGVNTYNVAIRVKGEFFYERGGE